MGSSQHERARPRRSRPAISRTNILVYERRVLIVVTILTLFALLLWLIAVSTDSWYSLRTPDQGIYVPKKDYFFYKANGGLWRVCRTYKMNLTEVRITKCQYHKLFASREEVGTNPLMDNTMLDYVRTQTAFSIISLLLMCMGIGFSVYTFREHRYMFKRLAGGVHFLTAATALVVIEVLVNSVKYASENLKSRIPEGTTWHYGFSFFLGWITFVFYVIAGLAFIICSRKRKDKVRGTDIHTIADEPHILGR